MNDSAIVLRTPSGISGDMLLTGLSRLADLNNGELTALVDSIGLPALHDAVRVEPHSVNHISGWKASIDLPHEHHHRTLPDIEKIIDNGELAGDAKQLAKETFRVLARAEAAIHGIPLEQVSFHEVGALDSILDICVSAALYCQINPHSFFCSPLPVCDGVIACDHGLLASPAPAVQEMLRDVPVYGIDSKGETITPTAIAFLRAAGAQFGKWPAGQIAEVARAYGGRILPGVPNGAMFFLLRNTV